MTGHRAPHNGNAYDFLSIGQPNGKLMPHHRPVVSVVLLNVGIGFSQCHGAHFKYFFTSGGAGSGIQ